MSARRTDALASRIVAGAVAGVFALVLTATQVGTAEAPSAAFEGVAAGSVDGSVWYSVRPDGSVWYGVRPDGSVWFSVRPDGSTWQ